MLQTAHIINIVNIFDKEYSTAQIYWVLPYQVAAHTSHLMLVNPGDL